MRPLLGQDSRSAILTLKDKNRQERGPQAVFVLHLGNKAVQGICKDEDSHTAFKWFGSAPGPANGRGRSVVFISFTWSDHGCYFSFAHALTEPYRTEESCLG